MKRILAAICLLWSAGQPGVAAGPALKNGEIESFRRELVSAQTPRNPARLEALCREAFGSGKYEALLACLNAGLVGDYLESLAKESSQVTRMAVLAMLNGSAETWHDRVPGAPAEMNTALYYPLAKGAIAVLNDILPPDQLALDNFRSPGGRAQLAAALRPFLVRDEAVSPAH